jgi:transcriptional regulator with XRE-family HTH domain/quercetin dioxygenase-like cupin family protein
MPAYASHSVDYEALRLGERIHAERQRQGLTLQQLSARSKISVSRLSQIENGHHVLDAVQADVIADALGLSLEAFLPADVRVPYVIARDADLRAGSAEPSDEFAQPSGGEQRRPLAERFVGRHLEPVFARVLPGADRFCYHHEHEFTFVLQGAIEFTVKTPGGVQQEELQRGDCIHFRSSLPHRLSALSAEPAECIQVISSGATPLVSGQDWRLAGFFPEGDSADGPAQVIGRELAALRQSRGWTTDQVAQMVGLKERQLHRIEAGARRLPFDVMIRLARAFGKPLRELVRDTRNAGPHYFVQRSNDMPQLAPRQRRMPTDRENAPTPNIFYPLASGFPTRHMYPYLIRVRNMDTETLARHEHHGEEFMYVLEGQLEVTTYAEEQKVTEILRPGDSCYIDASVPHFVRGLTRSPYSQISAEVLDVFWCPLGESYLFTD